MLNINLLDFKHFYYVKLRNRSKNNNNFNINSITNQNSLEKQTHTSFKK